MLDWNESLMFVADMSDPINPVTVGLTPSPGYPIDLLIMGEYAYIAGWASGIQIVYVGDY